MMGKITGFLEYQRLSEAQQPVKDRLKSSNSVTSPGQAP